MFHFFDIDVIELVTIKRIYGGILNENRNYWSWRKSG